MKIFALLDNAVSLVGMNKVGDSGVMKSKSKPVEVG